LFFCIGAKFLHSGAKCSAFHAKQSCFSAKHFPQNACLQPVHFVTLLLFSVQKFMSGFNNINASFFITKWSANSPPSGVQSSATSPSAIKSRFIHTFSKLDLSDTVFPVNHYKFSFHCQSDQFNAPSFFESLAPFFDSLTPFYDNLTPFFESLTPFYDSLTPFFNILTPFCESHSSFFDSLTPFYESHSSFYESHAPFYECRSPFCDSHYKFGKFTPASILKLKSNRINHLLLKIN
jgi:hypothetical protein